MNASDLSGVKPGPGSLGLYVHIPFCVRKCGYCDFFSVPYDPELGRQTLEALKAELNCRVRHHGLGLLVVESVYIGGGTPSLFCAREIEGLLNAIPANFPGSTPREVTVEVNPATVDRGWFVEVRGAGVNRVSIGVQSLDDRLLRCLGRVHTARDALTAFSWAREAGFTNVGLDLIYGIPGQDLASWEKTLREVAALGPEHVSAYELTLEPNTPLGAAVSRGEATLPGEAVVLDMFRSAGVEFGRAGLRRYEVSNYARPGLESIHNRRYWRRMDYLGIGPSAHSHLGGRRFWNSRDLAAYLDAVGSGKDPAGGWEIIDGEAARREQILLSLRTAEGVPLYLLGPDTGGRVGELLASGLARIHSDRLVLTEDGLVLADEVALRLV